MRVAHPSVWFHKRNKSPRPPDTDTDNLDAPSSFNPFYPANKDDPRPSSATTFRSLVSSSSSYPHRSTPTLHTQDLPHHPFALMAHAPLPVLYRHDSSDAQADCPVCLVPPSFSFRLPGEKPHIVPECGHALHEVRFSLLAGLPVIFDSSLVLLSFKSRLLLWVSVPRPR